MDKRLKIMKEDPKEIPSKEIFIPLGWDEDDMTDRKHYRFYYPDELEFIKEIFPKPSPFDNVNLKRGQSRGLGGGLFSSKKKKKTSTVEVVGSFKGLV